MSGKALAAAMLVALAGRANARPPASIDCPLQHLSAEQQVRFGKELSDHSDTATAKVDDAIAAAAAPCAKANGWPKAKADAAASWGFWAVAEAERRSGLSAADLATVRAYIDEDPARVAGINSDARLQLLVTALRSRGVHLHELSSATLRELGFVMHLQEMRTLETAFLAG